MAANRAADRGQEAMDALVRTIDRLDAVVAEAAADLQPATAEVRADLEAIKPKLRRLLQDLEAQARRPMQL